MIDERAYRLHVAVSHLAVILWQLYSAITAFRSGDTLAHLLQGLGATIGPGTAFFLLTHRWWVIVPVIFSVLAVIAVRKLERIPMFSATVLAAGVIAALALNIWWREAWFQPMFGLMKQIG